MNEHFQLSDHWLSLIDSGQENRVILEYEVADKETVADSLREAAVIAYRESGDTEASVQAAKIWFSLNPGKRATLQLGKANLFSNNWEEAIRLAGKLRERGEETPEGTAIRAFASAGLGDCHEALSAAAKIPLKTGSPAIVQLANLFVSYRCQGPMFSKRVLRQIIPSQPIGEVRRYALRLALINHWFDEMREVLSLEDPMGQSRVVLASRMALAEECGSASEADRWAHILGARELRCDGTLSFALGFHFYSRRRFRAARDSFIQAANSFKGENFTFGLEYVYAYLGASELKLWRPIKARHYATRALRIRQNHRLAQSTLFFSNLFLFNVVGAIKTVLQAIAADEAGTGR